MKIQLATILYKKQVIEFFNKYLDEGNKAITWIENAWCKIEKSDEKFNYLILKIWNSKTDKNMKRQNFILI